MTNISAIILTLNEERNIVECIQALREWCEDIVVFDSFSTDRTVELAKQQGARVFQRKFDNYANQRNAALETVEYPGEWVLMVDADERWGAALGNVIRTAIADTANADVGIFHFQRKDMFFGTWLKHGIGSNTWSGRLLRRSAVHVERDINEEYHCDGRLAYLRGERFVHHPFRNGVAWWIHRHNRYSTMEANRLLEERSAPIAWRDLFGRDPMLRRKALKQLMYRLPLRPFWMFGVLYFLKLGFLDGRAGFHYAVLRSIYEYFINLKMKELQYRANGDKG
ncbi:MAG: glycosyltransferase family 2 protein [Victivallales bacterium]|nr:glycosyltransferase family 2 protein [Victivallales bacterium]